MKMDKLIINYEGNASSIVDAPNELLAKYLWDADIEVTHIHNDEENKTILFYGYEMVNGLIAKILDKRRKNNLYEFLVNNKLKGINIKSELCEIDEFEQYMPEKYFV